MKYTGTLERIDIGPGFWALVTDEERFVLHDIENSDILIAGEEYTVEGEELQPSLMGFLMMQDVTHLNVENILPA